MARLGRNVCLLLLACAALCGRQAGLLAQAPVVVEPVESVGDPAWTLNTFPGEAWPRGDVPEAEALVEQARMKLRTGSLDISGATELLRKAVAIDPRHPYAWWRLGGLSVLPGGRYEDGLAMMRRQVDVAPSATAYKHGGYLLSLAGHHEQALPFFREGAAKYPDDREIAALLGEELLALGRNDEAAAVLAAQLVKYPDSSRLRLNLGRALLRAGAVGDAAPHLRSAVANEPVPQMWNTVSLTLSDAGADLDYAADLARQAAATMEGESARWDIGNAVDPARRRDVGLLVQSWRASGWAAFRRGDLETARSWLQAALELGLSPGDAYRLAQIEDARRDAPAATLAYGLVILWARPPNASAAQRMSQLQPTPAGTNEAMGHAEDWSRDLLMHIVAREGREQAQGAFAVVVDASGVVLDAAVDRTDVAPVGDVGDVVKALVGMKTGPRMPWNSAARTLRRGRLICDAQQPVCRVSMFAVQVP